MLLKLAWRNIWRNKLRSTVLAVSVIIGLWAGMFIMSFSWGLYKEHVQDVIESQLSHIQIHHPDFREDKLPEYTIQDGISFKTKLLQDERVKALSGRNLASGMISSPSYASGVSIYGVHPEEEKMVSTIGNSMVQGEFFSKEKRNEILIGEGLSKKLDVKLKNKIVLTFQAKGGEIISGSFRIVGIFRTQNSGFDESNVYTRFSDLSQLLGTGNEIHEIAILLKENDFLETIDKELSDHYPSLSVETWKDLAPELQLIVDSFKQYMYIFIAIILLALMFGIVNTMLMAVLERQHEFGMLMAIGMNKLNVFGMIIIETVLLTSVGIPIGLLLTYSTIGYFHEHGIDVSFFSKGLARFGFANVIHPDLEFGYYIPIALMTAASALISAIYPALKALKLEPATAIRKN